MHRGSRFLGVLEGPELTLLRRMEVIITDPRHHGLRILREKTISHRRFDNWSFASLPSAEAYVVPAQAEDIFIQMLTDRLP